MDGPAAEGHADLHTGRPHVGAAHVSQVGKCSIERVRPGWVRGFVRKLHVDEATHTLTHHVQGSNTRDLLVGKDLPRVYPLTDDGRLIIRSANPEEHWSVTWQHY